MRDCGPRCSPWSSRTCAETRCRRCAGRPSRPEPGLYELTRQGHKVCADTVGDLLREEGFSLQANSKTVEGKQHPDRDTQFRYINEQAKDHIGAGDPVVSVDSKKKELVGQYKNAGRAWQPTGDPVQVKTHDFLDREGPGKAIPYGIYDIAANVEAGSVSAPTTTPPLSRSPRSVAGGTGPDRATTPAPVGC